jgi:hypothetical protein
MSLVSVPYQDNGCDCGVFVCRYAYSLYTMRHQRFTRDDYDEKQPFLSLITRGPAFQFDMSDIDRIRGEISTLIDKLSELYLPLLKEQVEAARAAKRSAKQKGPSNDVHTDVTTGKDEGKADMIPAVASVEGNRQAMLFEEKENIQQDAGSQNSLFIAAPEKSSREGLCDDGLSLSLAMTHLEPTATDEHYSDDPTEERIVSVKIITTIQHHDDYPTEERIVVSEML